MPNARTTHGLLIAPEEQRDIGPTFRFMERGQQFDHGAAGRGIRSVGRAQYAGASSSSCRASA
ncbi:MAG TPA: hypothetical protein VK933_09575 [Longimicrobiales bacterium]|nr:hypothetical protein [Longimicrobiales bacterium]